MAETAFFTPKLYKGTAGRGAERPLCGIKRGKARLKQGAKGVERRIATMLQAGATGKTVNLRQLQ